MEASHNIFDELGINFDTVSWFGAKHEHKVLGDIVFDQTESTSCRLAFYVFWFWFTSFDQSFEPVIFSLDSFILFLKAHLLVFYCL